MASKEKWTKLFEKVIGRKPTPQEFLEGKKGFFDLKEIKKIAGVDKADDLQESSSDVKQAVLGNSATVVKPDNESSKEETKSTDKPVSTEVDKSPKQLWVEAFEKTIRRQPTPEEFISGRNQDFDLAKISQLVEKESVSKTSNLAKAPFTKGKKILIILGLVCLLALVVGYIYGNQYFSREAVAQRYLKVANSNFDKALEFEVWSDTEKPIKKSELTYRNSKETRTVTMDKLTSDASQMKKVGNKFLIFPDWRVAIKPASAKISINTKGLELFINDKRVTKADSDSFSQTISRLYPGTYNFVAKGNISGQKVEVSSEEKLTNHSTINLNVKYLSFKVNSNLTDGDLYVGSRKIGTLKDGKYNVTKLAVTDTSKIYVQKSFSGKATLKSEVQSIENVYDGDTISLDAKGVLDRDTADSLITQAYYKLDSYASSHTTPDDLDDIFTSGNHNNFYLDVKNTIDTNTTNAKNRSADSINFSDVDVTKVTQTSPTTYAVEFTVVYDFYYSYSSEHKSSGSITQKLSWSALVEYVGDNKKNSSDSYSYNSYEDYRITSDNGKSSVLSTKDTVD